MYDDDAQNPEGAPCLAAATPARTLCFLLGLGVGAVLWLNAKGVRRSLASMALTGGDAAVAAGKEIRRRSARAIEDVQDALAEARSERAQAEQARKDAGDARAALLSAVQELRADVASLRSRIDRTH